MNRDDGRRAALSRAVSACRRALVGDRKLRERGDIGKQLEAPNGFDPTTGVPKPIEQMGYLKSWQLPTAAMLRAWHAHLLNGAAGSNDAERARAAYDQMKYEIGYTALHRLAALRMAEERTIVRECVRRGRDSDGFRIFLKLTGDSGLGDHEETYAFFLARLYDELARDLPAVFDRRAAASLITPGPDALAAVLDAINAPELATVWADDETLGWIFEDYNDADERKEMREHDAPRNARELAVRNQFFTPRWVVEFLTDNTLGRLWYDLSGGKTELTESCRFLLKPAEAPALGCRDPRDLKILDPACGSGHFLLYVYDLLETIYREAWQGRHHRSAAWKPLWDEFPDEAAFQREIPRLILANNLHGVDIDPRCIQEAGLALWLRAHRSWDALKLKANERPRIAKVNLVCAQALSDAPGLKEKLRQKLKTPVLARLVDVLFLQVAEMGVLLRVETAIKDTVESVKKEYLTWKRESAQRDMFGEIVGRRQTTMDDFAKLREAGADEEFWKDADRLLLQALEALTDEAEDKDAYRSRLFAEEVRHELEFFDVSRIEYDVVLMNPPFGAPSESTKEALFRSYPNAGGELYAMFYERTLELLATDGRVGAITSRTWLALPTLERFRREALDRLGAVEIAADLGYGVLNAKVETAAAVIRKGGGLDEPATWVRLVKTGRKCETLLEALSAVKEHRMVSIAHARSFHALPARVCGYWMSDAVAKTYSSYRNIASIAEAIQGVTTTQDPRFLRLSWEIRAERIGLTRCWARFAKGGESRTFFDDIHLVIRWEDERKELVAVETSRPRDVDCFGRPGVTWPLRTNLRISPRVLPAGCAFGHKGPSALAKGGDIQRSLLAVLCSTPAYLLLSIRLKTADDSSNAISKSYEVGLIRDLPWPSPSRIQSERLALLATEAVEIVRLGQVEEDDAGETVLAYAIPPVLGPPPEGTRALSLDTGTRGRLIARENRLVQVAAIQTKIDRTVADAYGFSERDRQVMDEELEPPLASLFGTDPIDEDQFRTAYLTKDALDGQKLPGGTDAEMDVRVEHRRKKQVRLRSESTLCRIFQAPPSHIAALRRRLGLLRPDDLARAAADIISYAVGVAFGRWDIRLWSNPSLIPTFADPFDPMPPCPLGQLVRADGLPATEDRIASEAWLAARKHPTTLPEGEPAGWEVTARAYPIAVAWSGILTDDILEDGDGRRSEESFVSRVEQVLEHLFGVARSDWEHDIAAALGVRSVPEWLRTPSAFFADHLGRYSKSRRQAPIYWPLSTRSGGLVTWVYAPRFDAETLPLLVNRLRINVEDLRDERDRLRKKEGADRAKLDRLALLEREIEERDDLHRQLQVLHRSGYAPHPDDGFVITASPLHFAFRLPKWRDTLKATWDELGRGEYDWAHLAMRFRPDAVLEKCKTDRSLAIAHGREELYEAKEEKKRNRKRTEAKKAPAKNKQTTLPAAGSEDDT